MHLSKHKELYTIKGGLYNSTKKKNTLNGFNRRLDAKYTSRRLKVRLIENIQLKHRDGKNGREREQNIRNVECGQKNLNTSDWNPTREGENRTASR